MAITWKWDEKCGIATFEQNIDGEQRIYTVDLYVGNCFLIMLHEFTENGNEKYSLHTFFIDEEHMERCMKDNIFSRFDRLTDIRINKAKCRNWKKIVELLMNYMDEVTIKLYTDGEQIWREFKAPEPEIPDIRMRELAEASISYIYDNDMLEDFMEDRSIELSEKEKSYFCIYDDEYED